jgi:hypothetical protein
MRRLLTAATLAAAALLLPPAAARAQEGPATQIGDLHIVVWPPPKDECQHGYTEYVVTITNRSDDRPHEVTLSLPRYSYRAWYDYMQEVSRTARVGPGATVRVSLMQPYRPVLMGTGLAVSIDGRKQERFLDFAPRPSRVGPYMTYGSRGYGGYGATPAQSLVLVSRGVPTDFLTEAERAAAAAAPPAALPAGPGMPGAPRPAGGPMLKPAAPPKAKGPPGKGPPPPAGPRPVAHGSSASSGILSLKPHFTRPELDVAAWPTSWLAYSCYDGVVVSGDELGRAPAPVQTALWQFAETGGALLVLGEAKLPDGWRPRGQRSADYNLYDAGFGEAAVALDEGYARWPASRWAELRSAWVRTGGPWQHVRSVADANTAFPVVDDLSVPVPGLFALMLVFAVVIGPVNFIVLARKGRRLWVLWTVPLISLVTCLVVFGYMVAVEGWQGHRRAASLTLLDGHSHRAATIGWAGFYTPLTPGEGLHFGYDTEVAPQNAIEYRSGRSGGTAHTLAWGEDQHLARGWVTPRVPAHFMLRKSEVRRERVTVARGGDGRLSVVNGLGAEVTHFWYADERGRLHTAEGVTPGARAALTPTEVTVRSAAGPGLRAVYTGDWLTTMTNLPKHPEGYLTPGTYLAELAATPFVEEGLRGARPERAWSLVLGTLKGAGDES